MNGNKRDEAETLQGDNWSSLETFPHVVQVSISSMSCEDINIHDVTLNTPLSSKGSSSTLNTRTVYIDVSKSHKYPLTSEIFIAVQVNGTLFMGR